LPVNDQKNVQSSKSKSKTEIGMPATIVQSRPKFKIIQSQIRHGSFPAFVRARHYWGHLSSAAYEARISFVISFFAGKVRFKRHVAETGSLDRVFDCFTGFAGVLLDLTQQFIGLALAHWSLSPVSLAPLCFSLPLMMLRSPLISSLVIKFRDFDVEGSVPRNGSTANGPIEPE
jgi:hypothetical protein